MKLAMITVNFNSSSETIALVESLRAALLPPQTVLVVIDNGSRPEDRANLERYFATLPSTAYAQGLRRVTEQMASPGLHVCYQALDKNHGFAAANNVAYHYLRVHAQYVLAINNDVVVDPNAIARLMGVADAEAASALSPTIAYYSEPETVWYGGGRWTYEPALLSWHPTKGSSTVVMRSRPLQETRFISGAFILVRVRDVGPILFHDSFFFGGEDAELCHRIGAAGGRLLYVPDAIVWHKIGASRKKIGRPTWMRRCIIESKHNLMAMTAPMPVFVTWLAIFTPIKLVKEFFACLKSREPIAGVAIHYFGSLRHSMRLRRDADFRKAAALVRTKEVIASLHAP